MANAGDAGAPLRARLVILSQSAQTHIQRKFTEEVLDLRGLKFQLAVEVELRKGAPNGTEVLTVPVFRTKQIALLQAHEIPQALYEAFPGLRWRISPTRIQVG